MASGKSVIGKALSKQLGYNYIDLDSYIENQFNESISEIFKNKGEIFFRKKEATLLKKLIASEDNLIISAGGGTVCYGGVMDFLTDHKNVVTIYLKANIETLTNRLFNEKNNRPLIAHLKSKEDLDDFIRKHLFERSYYYNQSDFKFEVDNLSVKEISEQLALKLV